MVLNWNGVDNTMECVDHLLESKDVHFQVVLVDNGSDGDDHERLDARYGSDPRAGMALRGAFPRWRSFAARSSS